MDLRLVNYQDYGHPGYLDGRYFNIVLKHPSVLFEPIIIKINDTYAIAKNYPLLINFTRNPIIYCRIIIEVEIENKLVGRHSNLLIVDNINKIMYRFEPTMNVIYNDVINSVLMDLFKSYVGYKYQELPLHPQNHDKFNGYCVAYVIMYAYFSIVGYSVNINNIGDIILFSKAIKKLYGKLPTEGADIEFGYRGFAPIATGILGGALVGGLIGGVAGGAGGALVGAGLGGLTGGLVGGAVVGGYR